MAIGLVRPRANVPAADIAKNELILEMLATEQQIVVEKESDN